jgi:hypothetical protein
MLESRSEDALVLLETVEIVKTVLTEDLKKAITHSLTHSLTHFQLENMRC